MKVEYESKLLNKSREKKHELTWYFIDFLYRNGKDIEGGFKNSTILTKYYQDM